MIEPLPSARVGVVCFVIALALAGCRGPAPVPPAPTAANLPVNTQAPAPTATSAASPLPPTPTPAPTQDQAPASLQPVLTGPSISPDSWSPDGKWLAYWTRSPEEMACSEMCPPGTLNFLAPESSQTCAYPLKPDPYPGIAWQPDGRVLVFAGGSARTGTPCQDDFREATSEETGYADGSLSPDGRYRVQTEAVETSAGIAHLVTTITELTSGDGMNWVEWQIQQRIGFLGLGGEWLPDGSFLIYETDDRGPLLVPVGKEPVPVGSAWFGVSAAPAGTTWRALVKRVAGTTSYHAVLYAVGTESAFPPVRLYHSETGQAEELPFQYIWNTPFSPDGRYLFLRFQSESGPQYREVDPPGAPFQPVPGPSSPVYAWSSDGSRIAFMTPLPLKSSSGNGVTPEGITALDFPQGTPIGSWQAEGYLLYPSTWSPDQSTLAARGTLPEGKGDGLFLIDTGISTAPATPRATPLKLPGGLTVEEYTLKDRPSIEPLVFEPAQGRMDGVLKKRAFFRDGNLQLYYANNQALRPFGYRLAPELFPPASDMPWTLLKDGQALLDQVADFGPVTVNEDGSDFIFSLSRYNVSVGMYLVRNGSMEQGKGDPYTPRFGLLGRDLVEFAGLGAEGTVQLSRAGRVIYSASTGQPSSIPDFWGLWTFGGHWALEVLDNSRPGSDPGTTPAGQVILDGVSLNQRHGYQESFGFRLLGGEPFYFFRKDGKIGAAFAGQPVLLDYDNIPHYGCCSAAELNPRASGNMVWFFAEREGAWYYVEIGSFL